MHKVAIIGECMVELYQVENSLYKQTFGGDTFNCSVYLKRSLQNAEVEYITVLGKDSLSYQMLSFFHNEGIKSTYIDELEEKYPGLYMIHTQEGERSFSYWRENSAAKELFLTPSLEKIANDLLTFDLIYFSAITLAIMSEEGRNNLFKIIKKARSKGVKIAFDSNYRPRLYKSSDEAKSVYNQAIYHCDIFLPSLDDEKQLWGNINPDDIIKKAKEVGCKEIVVKCGKEDIIYNEKDSIKAIKTKQIKEIVDSTSAGDSFNGAFLAARLDGFDIKQSIKKAQNLASKVIMYQGAIIPKEKKCIE